MGTHLLIPSLPGSAPRGLQVEMLVHQLGHFLGATHSPEPASVMRLGLDRLPQGMGIDALPRFDALNTLVISLVAEHLGREGAGRLTNLQATTRRVLHGAYAVAAEALPDDPLATGEADTNLLVPPPTTPSNWTPPTALDWSHARLVMQAVQTAARANQAPLSGDQLTEMYVREAAQAAARLAPEHRAPALMLGLGMALDQSGQLRSDPLFRLAFHAAQEGPSDAAAPAGVPRPTMHGRGEASDAFFATLALDQLAGRPTAHDLTLRRQLSQARRTGVFRWDDYAAALSGLALAERLRQSPANMDQLAAGFRVADYVPDVSQQAALSQPTWDELLQADTIARGGLLAQQRQAIQQQIQQLAAERARAPADGGPVPNAADLSENVGGTASQPGSSTQAQPAGDGSAPGRPCPLSPPTARCRTWIRCAKPCKARGPPHGIRLAPGDYIGNLQAENLHGTAQQPIVIEAQDPQNPPRLNGGTLQLSRCSHLTLDGLVFARQEGVALKIDDANGPDSPSHHVTLSNLLFQDTGHNGTPGIAVRLMGVNDLAIEGCQFNRWTGLALDLVGCHRGVVSQCHFTNVPEPLGYAVQVHGGSSRIVVRQCTFRDCGWRAVNIGGNTDEDAFRPRGAACKAQDITVEGCTFQGGETAVAMVGVDRAAFRFNTVVRPRAYVLCILQESRKASMVRSRFGAL